MPVKEEDPWRKQYFEAVACPDDVIVPTEDGDAYQMFPTHRWVYNKLLICETQGIEHAPHGFAPARFPVFSKPIYNMRGMGAGSRVLRSYKEYQQRQEPGHMWMELMEGEHVSTDGAVVDGQVRWWRHVVGKSLGDGIFDYWTVQAEAKPALEAYCAQWVGRNLAGYTGMVNFETIGGRIIECHLRFSDQWPDLYGKGWVESLVELYTHKRWSFRDDDRRTGYSVVLFGGHGLRYRHPDPAVVQEILREPSITSVQVTFHEDRPPTAHSMPPGGFRLAIVNGWNLETGFAAREKLALSFWSTMTLYGRRRRGQAAAAAPPG